MQSVVVYYETGGFSVGTWVFGAWLALHAVVAALAISGLRGPHHRRALWAALLGAPLLGSVLVPVAGWLHGFTTLWALVFIANHGTNPAVRKRSWVGVAIVLVWLLVGLGALVLASAPGGNLKS